MPSATATARVAPIAALTAAAEVVVTATALERQQNHEAFALMLSERSAWLKYVIKQHNEYAQANYRTYCSHVWPMWINMNE